MNDTKRNKNITKTNTTTMKHNMLLTCVIYYSLFHKKCFDNDKSLIQSLPKNAFGIFTTIRRAHKLKVYPVDIHGCIGYWNNEFNKLSQEELYTNLLRVSYDALWTDNRQQYFEPIETDPHSYLEMDFMLKPIYKIDNYSGIIIDLNQQFTNNSFGIIIQHKDGSKKATYLPNVFPKMSWIKIVNSIKHKANIIDDNYDVFAYKITQIKAKLITLLSDELFGNISLSQFARLLIDNMNPNLNYPFVYSCKNDTLSWNANDEVRNIATLGDILKYITLYHKIANKKELELIKYAIFNILENKHKYSSQALSFLGHIYDNDNSDNNDDKTQFCKKLLQDLPSAENDFEKPEIIIGLRQAGCMINIKDIIHLLTYNLEDSIFRMNWIIQTIISFNKKPSLQLVYILEEKINEILSKKTITETNYIAVAFEALCFVYSSNGKISLLNKLFELLFELEKRKNCYNNILYTFLDKTARIDITGHINNGLCELGRSRKLLAIKINN